MQVMSSRWEGPWPVEGTDERDELLVRMKAEVKVVYQTVDDLRRCLMTRTDDEGRTTENCPSNFQLSTFNFQPTIGDWYFTGDYPTPGGYKVLNTALHHYIEKSNERSY